METIIKEIQDNIFEYNTGGIKEKVSSLINSIANIMDKLDPGEVRVLNEILKYINIGLENRDYLLVADILKYELTPFIDKALGMGGNN